MGLTEEQRKRMEENKRLALLKRQQKMNQQTTSVPPTPSSWTSSSSSSSSSTTRATSLQQTNKLWRPECLSKPKSSVTFSSDGSGGQIQQGQIQNQKAFASSFSKKTYTHQAQQLFLNTGQSGHSVPGINSQAANPVADKVGGASSFSQPIGGHQRQPQTAYGTTGQKTLTQFYGTKSSDGQEGSNVPPSSGRGQSAFASRAQAPQQLKGGNVQARTSSTAVKPGDFPSSGPSLAGQCILISRSRFMVDIGYHAKLIEIFKSIGSKSYDMTTKKWSFSLANYDELLEASKVLRNEVSIKPLPDSILLAFRSQRQGNFTRRDVPEVNLEFVDEKLVQSLMPFQRVGVNFAIHHGGRALIADEMGLGKTIQAICIACYYRQEWPMLVVTPSSMRFSWSEAFLKWIPSLEEDEVNVITTSKDTSSWGLVNIISYDLMSRTKKALEAKRFRVIIFDESHFLKNYKTARTKAALPLLKAASRVILLSGTPALSRPCELFQQINAVNPRLFPSFHEFAIRYCDAKQNHFGWDYSGSSNLAELQLLLEEKVMVRRMKKDVLKQLPSKMRQVVMMNPDTVKTSSRSLKVAEKDMQNKPKSDQHGALLKYFAETGAAKIPALREYVVDMAESGHKFLIFAHHQTVLDAMSEGLSAKEIKFIRIDGSTSSHHRNELVAKFQSNDSYQVAVLSITACNAGITLTAASSVIFAELFWNPGILVQAEDRVHRIGQQDSVTVKYLIAKGTADDYIWPLVQRKLETLSKAGLSGDDFQAADTTVMKDPKQRSILSYFEQSFIEDELSQDDIAMLEAAEAAAYSDGGKENTDNSNVLDPSNANCSEKFTGESKCETGSLFSSLSGATDPCHSTSRNVKTYQKFSSFEKTEPAVKKPRLS